MLTMQVTKKVDHLGRIVLPMDFRKALGLTTDSKVLITLENEELKIKRNTRICKICNSTHLLDPSIDMCQACIQKIKLL